VRGLILNVPLETCPAIFKLYKRQRTEPLELPS
jgi:hypothetical protein